MQWESSSAVCGSLVEPDSHAKSGERFGSARLETMWLWVLDAVMHLSGQIREAANSFTLWLHHQMVSYMHAARNSVVISQTQVQFGSQTLPGNQTRFYFNHVSHHQYIKERSDSIQHLLLSYNMAHTTINVLSCPTVLDFSNHDGFFDSTHRAIPFLPNPGCHPWCDQAIPSTNRRWCLREYTYSRRISLWNIQHDKCFCRYLIIIAGTG